MPPILAPPLTGRNPGAFAVHTGLAERPSTTPVAAGKKTSKRPPYAAVPHALRADPRLIGTDVDVAAALCGYARAKDHCWPSDPAIGRAVRGRSGKGLHRGTVSRSLGRLESAGWIRREKTKANRSGRLIVLVWMADGVPSRATGATPEPAPARQQPDAPARHKEDVIVKGEPSKGREIPPERSRPEPQAEQPKPVAPVLALREVAPASRPPAAGKAAAGSPGRPAAGQAPASSRPAPAWSPSAEERAAWLGSDDPILRAEAARKLAPPPPRPEPPASVPELLARVREDPSNVAAAAELLAQGLDDRRSWAGFHAACRRAWSGEIPAEALVIAHREATSGKARNPGALFMAVLKREVSAFHRRC